MGSKVPVPPPPGQFAKPSPVPPPPPRRCPDGVTELFNQINALKAELFSVRSQAHNDSIRAQQAEQYERWLLDIGRFIGCGHVDERLPQCMEEEFLKRTFDSADTQAIALALQKLAEQRPGWKEYLRGIAEKIPHAAGFFDSFAAMEGESK